MPDDERKDATSVLDVRNKGLVEEVGRRTDSVVEIDPERREVVVVADAHDTIVKALDMLKVLRRHLVRRLVSLYFAADISRSCCPSMW